jgi:hypothetical protein
MKTTKFKKFVIEKIKNEDYNFTLGEVALICYFSKTSSGNISSGRFADFVGIPADSKSIEIFNKVKSFHDYIGKCLSFDNYKKIITHPENYSDMNVRNRYSIHEFKKSTGWDFNSVFVNTETIQIVAK